MTQGFLTDSTGKPSHTRLLVALCVPLLVLLPLGIWAFLCVLKAAFLPIDPTVPLYIGTANGIATALKVASTRWIISGTNLT